MDSARCICGKHFVTATCPIHGPSSPHPSIPWTLTWNDKQQLRTMRIDPEDGSDIQQTRQADEDRFRP